MTKMIEERILDLAAREPSLNRRNLAAPVHDKLEQSSSSWMGGDLKLHLDMIETKGDVQNMDNWGPELLWAQIQLWLRMATLWEADMKSDMRKMSTQLGCYPNSIMEVVKAIRSTKEHLDHRICKGRVE
jgi:hypothetical protein